MQKPQCVPSAALQTEHCGGHSEAVEAEAAAEAEATAAVEIAAVEAGCEGGCGCGGCSGGGCGAVAAVVASVEVAVTVAEASAADCCGRAGRCVGGLMSRAAAAAILSETLAAVAVATIAFHLGRARICSSSDGVALCLKVSRSLLLTTPVPTTTIFEAMLMLYGMPSGSTTPVCDTAFLGGMSDDGQGERQLV